MFNFARAEQDEPQYPFNLTKYYKIWFSKYPDVYMGVENELRFIRMRVNNQTAILSFIYSAKCLNKQAIEALNIFCEKYSIFAIKFEDLLSQMAGPEDKALYSIATEEIARAVDGTGGNMAGASDCARILTPIIEQYGISSDFDVETQLTKLGAPLVSLRAPMLFPADMIQLKKDHILLTPNSDFLAFSIENPGSERLSSDALFALRNLKQEIIRNYTRPFSFSALSRELTPKYFVRYPGLVEIIDMFHHLYPENPSIFDFRTYLATLPSGPKGQRSAKNLLMSLSVINISGPGTYSFLYKHLFPKGHAFAPMDIPDSDPKWLPYLALYERSGTGFYDAIFDLIQSKNSVNGIVNSAKSVKKERLCDQSWTTEGEMAKKAREKDMQKAALSIQRFWKHQAFLAKKSVDHILYSRAQKLCTEEQLLTPLKEKKYTFALRRACGGIKTPIVKLLLHYNQRGSITIDLNEPSTSNGNTALDWVIKAQPTDAEAVIEQQGIIRLLKDAGAMTAEELKRVISLSATKV